MEWLRRFMMGRYGVDQLSIAFLILYFFLSILGNFTRLFVFVLLSYIPFFLCWFRVFSRNISKRYAENSMFLKIWNPLKQKVKNWNHRITDRGHRYYKFTNCSNILRVPRGKGKICITCPVCRKEFIKKT